MLPIIPISELQRSPKATLASVKDYAVVQSHGRDRAFILHPDLGRVLLETGMLELLRHKLQKHPETVQAEHDLKKEIEDLIGNVLRELSKH